MIRECGSWYGIRDARHVAAKAIVVGSCGAGGPNLGASGCVVDSTIAIRPRRVALEADVLVV